MQVTVHDNLVGNLVSLVGTDMLSYPTPTFVAGITRPFKKVVAFYISQMVRLFLCSGSIVLSIASVKTPSNFIQGVSSSGESIYFTMNHIGTDASKITAVTYGTLASPAKYACTAVCNVKNIQFF